MRTRVIAARGKKDWTQEDLAKALDVDQSTVSRIERGIGEPSGGVLVRLCELLRISPSDALFDDADPRPSEVG